MAIGSCQWYFRNQNCSYWRRRGREYLLISQHLCWLTLRLAYMIVSMLPACEWSRCRQKLNLLHLASLLDVSISRTLTVVCAPGNERRGAAAEKQTAFISGKYQKIQFAPSSFASLFFASGNPFRRLELWEIPSVAWRSLYNNEMEVKAFDLFNFLWQLGSAFHKP